MFQTILKKVILETKKSDIYIKNSLIEIHFELLRSELFNFIFGQKFGEVVQLISWNVNGIRAIEKKGFKGWLIKQSPDIMCLQEIKALPEQIPESLLDINGYQVFWSSAVRKGYSGVGVYTKLEPNKVEYGLGIKRFDDEGRTIILEFDDFTLYNVYFPNGKKDESRLNFKLSFYEAFLKHIEIERKSGKNIIVCGDVNTAHKPIDLARPKQNEDISGFLPVERKWIDKLIAKGYVDTFREFVKDPDHYSWWSYRAGAREKNVGWRIDYFFANEEFRSKLKNAFILDEVMGSDHCPIGLEIA